MDLQTSLSPMRIDVFSLPEYVPSGYQPEVALFIDVLRATTTITAALEAGVKKIIPVMEPEQAFSMKKILEKSGQGQGEIILGGERKGVKIDGFDLGNSPGAYTPEAVRGKRLIFSTTNGTRAVLTFERNKDAAVSRQQAPVKGGPSLRRNQDQLPRAARTRIYLASFLNAGAAAERVKNGGFRSVGIVCSGTDRRYTEEDILLAGLLVSRLAEGEERAERRPVFNVQAETARYIWESFFEKTAPETIEKQLYSFLAESRGGQNVKRIKLLGDIRFAAQLDISSVLPEYSLGEIRSDTF